MALHVARHGHTSQCKQRGSDVDVEHNLVQDRVCLDQSGIADKQRQTNGFLISQPPFHTQAMFAVEVSVVAGEDDDCVIQLPRFLERIEYLSDTVFNSHQCLLPFADNYIARSSALGRAGVGYRPGAATRACLPGRDWHSAGAGSFGFHTNPCVAQQG